MELEQFLGGGHPTFQGGGLIREQKAFRIADDQDKALMLDDKNVTTSRRCHS